MTRYKQEVSQAEVKQQSEGKEAARTCSSERERERDSPEGVRGRPMSFNHRTTVSVGQGVIGGAVTWSRLTEGRGALVWFSGVLVVL